MTDSRKSIICWVVTILPCLILLLPASEIMTAELKVFLAVTFTAILFFVFGQVNGTVVSILLPIAYVLILEAPLEVVYRPWSMSILWKKDGKHSRLYRNIAFGKSRIERDILICIIVCFGKIFTGCITHHFHP